VVGNIGSFAPHFCIKINFRDNVSSLDTDIKGSRSCGSVVILRKMESYII
jgi:hypothetical protein